MEVGRIRRAVPALAAAALAALGAGSLALANDGEGHQQGKGTEHAARCDQGRLSAWDEQWLTTSIEGDRFEIAGGTIAQQKGQLGPTRTLGAVLVRDHSKSLGDATTLAQRLGVDVPPDPSPSQQWELQVVSTFSGPAFDHWYADLEVKDHTQDIQEAQDEAGMGCNRAVRHMARQEIPTLQKHLELSRAALDAAG